MHVITIMIVTWKIVLSADNTILKYVLLFTVVEQYIQRVDNHDSYNLYSPTKSISEYNILCVMCIRNVNLLVHEKATDSHGTGLNPEAWSLFSCAGILIPK